MKQIIKFLERNRYFLLFLVLEFFSFIIIIQSHSYHKSKIISSANNISGGIHKKINSINIFLNLKKENQYLLKENTRLKNLLSIEQIDTSSVKVILDSTKKIRRFSYASAKIIKNDYTKRNNYLLINKGAKNGITSEMAVVNSNGIIGITNNVSNHYSTVISILNKYLKINAKIKSSNHFGTLTWDGNDYKIIQLEDLPRQAQFKIGDTVVTGGKSTIFPEGILIGTIKDYKKSNGVYQYINILLFNDMSSLSNVNVIKNMLKEEIKQLEANNE